MKMMKRKTIALTMCAVLLLTVGFIANSATANKASDVNTVTGQPLLFDGDSSVIAQNERYRLVCYQNPVSFAVYDQADTEPLFSTSVSNAVYDVDGSSTVWKNYMQAIAAIRYADKDEYKGTTIQDFSSASTTNINIFAAQDGAVVELYFTKPKIGFSILVQLSGNTIDVTIPENSITEDDKYQLLSVEVFPFMGATPNIENGYFVYPDGAGALTYFDKVEEKHLYTQAYTLDIYSDLSQESLSESTSGAMLPIYGMKSGEKAFLAAVTEGDSSASIKINPGINSSAVKLNRASFELTYRNSHRFYLSNIVVNGKDTAKTIYGTEWDDKMVPGDRSIKFFLLQNEDADYSGMANAYRNYLIETVKLRTASSVKETRTSVSMVMGAVQKTIFGSNYVESTTFRDAADFIGEYRNLGMEKYAVILSGWNKGGIYNYNSFYKPESSLGGWSGLKQLDKLEAQIYLESDILSNTTERNAIKQGNLIPVANDDQTRFIAKIGAVTKKFNKLQKSLKKVDSLHIAYRYLGNSLYYDAGDYPAFRVDEISTFRELLAESKSACVQGGNLYLLDLADYLYDIPTDTSDHVLIDEEIPLYGMIVYGSVPYSSDSGNNSSNFKQTKLKWLEYGCIPYFEITNESPQALQNSDRNYLYSSRNSYWKKKIADCNKEWSEDLSVLCGAYMIRHQRVSDTLVKITYSNGYVTLINYANEDVTYNGTVIKAESYILAKE